MTGDGLGSGRQNRSGRRRIDSVRLLMTGFACVALLVLNFLAWLFQYEINEWWIEPWA